jgi:hypothetical protein
LGEAFKGLSGRWATDRLGANEVRIDAVAGED